MMEDPRFPSLLFRQRLNAVGLPFLLTVGFLCAVTYFWISFLLVFLAVLFLLLFVFLREKEKRITLFCIALGISLGMTVFFGDSIRQEKYLERAGQTFSVQGVVTEVGDEFYDVFCYREENGVFLAKIRVTPSENFPEKGDRIVFSCYFSEELPLRFRQDSIDLCGKDNGDLQIIGKNYFYSAIGSIQEYLKSFFGNSTEGGFYRAVLFGDRSALSESANQIFSRAASSHLLAISGLHMMQILGFFLFLFRLLPIPRRTSIFLFFPIILFFVLFSGASVSVFRAGFMTAMAFAATLVRRRGDSVTSLVLAAVILTWIEPFSLGSLSFLLSFSSTFAIVFCALPLCQGMQNRILREEFREKRRLSKALFWLLSPFVISVCIFVFTFPLQVFLFDSVQLCSPIASMLLIPFFAPVLFMGLLSSVCSFIPFVSSCFLQISFLICKGFLFLVKLVGEGFLPLISYGDFSIWIGFFALLALLYLILLKKPMRYVLIGYPILFFFSLFFLF